MSNSKREQFKAMLWVRRRILANRLSRRGKINNVLFGLLLLLGLALSLGIFSITLLIGVKQLPTAESMEILVVWVALCFGFLLFWMIGLMTELSRSDSMSFKNLLPLPVSLGWVFVFNYLSSFISLSIAFFLPAMLGLALAMTTTFGLRMLLCFPLILGFFVLVTALTYHLRGWLARVMEDKRKGKNILMGITFGFVLLIQLPNFLNLASSDSDLDYKIEKNALQAKVKYQSPGHAEAKQKLEGMILQEKADAIVFEQRIVLATQVVPFGWLPYGMRALYRNQLIPVVLCILGFFLLGGLSLRRSYRTTLRAIVEGVGHGEKSKKVSAQSIAAEAVAKPQGKLLVERNLCWVADATSGIAFANLCSLLRAPETKMMLLGPIMMFGFMGLALAKSDNLENLQAFTPGMILGAISMGLISVNQLLQNQFGLDRTGFRAFLLSPVPRYQILVGKNFTLAPFGITIGLVALCGLQFFMPADFTHFLGGVVQVISAFMLLCLLGNMLSIYAPIRLRELGTKAVKPKFSTFVLQFLTLLFVPLTLSPLLLPWGAEFLLRNQAWAALLPVYLLLHLLLLAGVCLFYRAFVRIQGAILQEREQEILDILTRD